jgi:hypothetical protein
MKMLTTLFIALMISVKVLAPSERFVYMEYPEAANPFEPLFKAVCAVESNFDPLAYNPNEKACGIAQIREVRLRDYNVRFNKKVPQIALFDVETSKMIFMAYASQIGPYDFEQIAKRWNGSGSLTIEYWRKVKAKLNN